MHKVLYKPEDIQILSLKRNPADYKRVIFGCDNFSELHYS